MILRYPHFRKPPYVKVSWMDWWPKTIVWSNMARQPIFYSFLPWQIGFCGADPGGIYPFKQCCLWPLGSSFGILCQKKTTGIFNEIKPTSDIDASEDGAMLPIFGKFTNSWSSLRNEVCWILNVQSWNCHVLNRLFPMMPAMCPSVKHITSHHVWH